MPGPGDEQQPKKDPKVSRANLLKGLREENIYDGETVEHFEADFKEPEVRVELYNELKRRNLYTKELADFQTQFFGDLEQQKIEKKKEVAAKVVEPTSQPTEKKDGGIGLSEILETSIFSAPTEAADFLLNNSNNPVNPFAKYEPTDEYFMEGPYRKQSKKGGYGDIKEAYGSKEYYDALEAKGIPLGSQNPDLQKMEERRKAGEEFDYEVGVIEERFKIGSIKDEKTKDALIKKAGEKLGQKIEVLDKSLKEENIAAQLNPEQLQLFTAQRGATKIVEAFIEEQQTGGDMTAWQLNQENSYRDVEKAMRDKGYWKTDEQIAADNKAYTKSLEGSSSLEGLPMSMDKMDGVDNTTASIRVVSEYLNGRTDLTDTQKSAMRTYLTQRLVNQPKVEKVNKKIAETTAKMGLPSLDEVVGERKIAQTQAEKLSAQINQEVAQYTTRFEAQGKMLDEQYKGRSESWNKIKQVELSTLQKSLQMQVEQGSMTEADASKALGEAVKVATDEYNQMYKGYMQGRSTLQSQMTAEHARLKKSTELMEKQFEALDANFEKKYGMTADEYKKKYKAVVESIYEEESIVDKAVRDAEWKDLNLFGKVGVSLLGGANNLMEAAFGSWKYFAPNSEVPDAVLPYIDNLRENLPQKDMGKFAMSHMLDSDWWIKNLGEQVPLMLPGAGAGALGARLTLGALGKGTALSLGARQAASAMVGGAASRLVESNMEAQGAFMTAMKNGKTYEEAMKSFKEVRDGNMVLMGVDALQMYFTFSKAAKLDVSKRTTGFAESLKSTASFGGKRAFQMFSGGYEELYQESLIAKQENPYLTFGQFANSEAGKEIFWIGAMMDLGMDGAMGGWRDRSAVAQINKSIKSYFDQFDAADVSIDDINSRLHQLNSTLATLEGQGVLSDEELKDARSKLTHVTEVFAQSKEGILPFDYSSPQFDEYSTLTYEQKKLQKQADDLSLKGRNAEKELVQEQISIIDKRVKELATDPEVKTYSYQGTPVTKEEFESLAFDYNNKKALESGTLETDDTDMLKRMNAERVQTESTIARAEILINEDSRRRVAEPKQEVGITPERVDKAIETAKIRLQIAENNVQKQKSGGNLVKAIQEQREAEENLISLEFYKTDRMQAEEAIVEDAVADGEVVTTPTEEKAVEEVAAVQGEPQKQKKYDIPEDFIAAHGVAVEDLYDGIDIAEDITGIEVNDEVIGEDGKGTVTATVQIEGPNGSRTKEVVLPSQGQPVQTKEESVKGEGTISQEGSKIEDKIVEIESRRQKELKESENKKSVGIGFEDGEYNISTMTQGKDGFFQKVELTKEEKREIREIENTKELEGNSPELVNRRINLTEKIIARLGLEGVTGATENTINTKYDAEIAAIKEPSAKETAPKAEEVTPTVETKAPKEIPAELETFVPQKEPIVLKGFEAAPTPLQAPTKEKDTAKDVDADVRRGYRVIDGVKYSRPEPVKNKVVGEKTVAVFTPKEIVEAEFVVMEADDVQQSHYKGKANFNFFLGKAQPKARGQGEFMAKTGQMKAQALNPIMLGGDTVAYYGAPVVNERGEVIQGNGRSEAVKIAYNEFGTTSGEKYRQYLIDNAAKFGLDADKIKTMKMPVMVRMVKADDATATKLGQFTDRDLQDVGGETAEAKGRIRRLDPASIEKIAEALSGSADEDATLRETIRAGGKRLMDTMKKAGAISEQDYLDGVSKDTIKSSLIDTVANFFKALVLEGGIAELSTELDRLPNYIIEGIERATIPLLQIDKAKDILPDFHIAILGIREYLEAKKIQGSGYTFNQWANSPDLMYGAPSERYSPAQLELIKFLAESSDNVEANHPELHRIYQEEIKGKKGKPKSLTQKNAIAKFFIEYAKLTKPTEGDMFNPDGSPGASKIEAINQLLGTKLTEDANIETEGADGFTNAETKGETIENTIAKEGAGGISQDSKPETGIQERGIAEDEATGEIEQVGSDNAIEQFDKLIGQGMDVIDARDNVIAAIEATGAPESVVDGTNKMLRERIIEEKMRQGVSRENAELEFDIEDSDGSNIEELAKRVEEQLENAVEPTELDNDLIDKLLEAGLIDEETAYYAKEHLVNPDVLTQAIYDDALAELPNLVEVAKEKTKKTPKKRTTPTKKKEPTEKPKTKTEKKSQLDDKLAAAEKELRDLLKGLNKGPGQFAGGPSIGKIVLAGIKYGYYYISKMAEIHANNPEMVNKKTWKEGMISTFGEVIEPYLETMWGRAVAPTIDPNGPTLEQHTANVRGRIKVAVSESVDAEKLEMFEYAKKNKAYWTNKNRTLTTKVASLDFAINNIKITAHDLGGGYSYERGSFDRYNIPYSDAMKIREGTGIKLLGVDGSAFIYKGYLISLKKVSAYKGKDEDIYQIVIDSTPKVVDQIIEENTPKEIKERKEATKLGAPETQQGKPRLDERKGKERPPLTYTNYDMLPQKVDEYITEAKYGPELDKHQRYAVNMALTNWLSKGQRGFLLNDSMGVGKTRQILAAAAEYYRQTGKPVLIVTENKQIIETAFAEDAVAMGITLDPKAIQLITYSALEKQVSGDFGLVIYDEAHNLKNPSKAFKNSGNIVSDHTMYSTATPGDKVGSAIYFLADLIGISREELMGELGITEGDKGWEMRPGKSELLAVETINDYIQKAYEDGKIIRREYPFWGAVIENTIALDPVQREEAENVRLAFDEQIDKVRPGTYFDEATGEMKSSPGRRKWDKRYTGLSDELADALDNEIMRELREQKINMLDKLIETFKVKAIVRKIKNDIANGRSAVVVSQYVNDIKIKGLDKKMTTETARNSFLQDLKEALLKEGIPFVEITGKTDKVAAVKAFQSGQVKVVIGSLASMAAGINLDDVTGSSARSLYVASASYDANEFNQVLGRVSRRNSKTPAEANIFYGDTDSETSKKGKVTKKTGLLGVFQGAGIDADTKEELEEIESFRADREKRKEERANKKKVPYIEEVKVEGDIVKGGFILVKDSYDMKNILGGLGGWYDAKNKGWRFPLGRKADIQSIVDKFNAGELDTQTAQQARDAYSFFSSQTGTGTNRQEVNDQNKSTGAAATQRIDVAPILGGTPKKRAAILQDMLKTFKAFVRYGNPGNKRAAGVYKMMNSEIKVRTPNDFDTIAHEVGHYLDDKFKLTPLNDSILDAELAKFWEFGSSAPAGMSKNAAENYIRAEGMAEFIRAMIYNPGEAKAKSPALWALVMSKLPDDVKAAIESFSSDIRTMHGLSAIDQMRLSVKETDADATARGTFWQNRKRWWDDMMKRYGFTNNKGTEFYLTWWDKLTRDWADKLAPFKKAANMLMKANGLTQKDVKPADNPYMLARLFAGIGDQINNMVEKGMMRRDASGKFERIVDPVTRQNVTLAWMLAPIDTVVNQLKLDEFSAKVFKDKNKKVRDFKDLVGLYMVAERTLALKDRFERESLLTGIGISMTDAETAKKALEEFENMGPALLDQIKEAARRYRAFADTLLQYMLDAGRISADQVALIKQNNLQYVAMQRVQGMEPGQEVNVIGSKDASGRYNLNSEIKGSARDRFDPYENLMTNLYKVVEESNLNNVLNSFVDMMRNNRGMQDGDLTETAAIGRPIQLAPGTNIQGKPILTVYNDGVKEYWEIDQDVFDSIERLWKASKLHPGAKLFLNTFGLLAKTVRFTVTKNPMFAFLRNPPRDIQARWVQSRTFGKGSISQYEQALLNMGTDPTKVKELAKTAKLNTKQAREGYELYGGSQSGHYIKSREHYYAAMDRELRKIAKDKKVVIVDIKTLQQLWNNYDNWLASGERLTRVKEYKSAYLYAKSKLGYDDYNASLYAAFQARDLMDFAVMGIHMEFWNQIVPFSNASMQGTIRTMKAFAENPTGTLQKFGLVNALPAIGAYLLAGALGYEDEYEQLPAYRRDMFYNFKIPSISTDTWIVIPKPFELGVMGSFFERAYQGVKNGEVDKAFEGYTGSLLKSMMPIKYTDLLGPFQAIVEANSNYSFFYGSNLIPTHEDRQALALRKNKNKGSNLGILIGDGIGVDPRKVDHVIRSWFTFFGDVAIKTSDAFPREVPGQKRNKFNFWNLTGLIKAREPKNFTSMQYLQDKMKKYDLYDSPDAESIVMLIEQFDEEQTEEGRDELAKVIVTEAKRIEQAWKRNIKTYERVLNGENVPYLETELSKDNKKIAKDLLFNN